MTTVATRTAADPRVPPKPGRASRLAAAVRGWFRGTPGAMRLASIVLVLACLLVALLGGIALQARASAIGRAADNTAQLGRVQEIRTNLLRANAAAGSALMVGGIEPPARIQTYDTSLRSAATLLAAAAEAQPADTAALAVVSQVLVEFAGSVERARANNRQGFPIGADYLRNAGVTLDRRATPVLDALVVANTERARQEFGQSSGSGALLYTIAVAALTLLLVALVWLAHRTHRYLNLPMVLAGIAVLIALVVGAALLGAENGRVRDVRDHQFAAAIQLGEARKTAFAAWSAENLMLIARGSSDALNPRTNKIEDPYEASWQESATRSRLALQATHAAEPADPVVTRVATSWADYTRTHEAIVRQYQQGNWEAAVATATRSADSGAFRTLDSSSGEALDRLQAITIDQLDGATLPLVVGRWLIIVLGAIAALLCWWGISQRLEEYR